MQNVRSFGYPLGWFFLVLAFVAAAAEAMSHTDGGIRGIFVPAHDVLAALAPNVLIHAQVGVSRVLGPWAWDPGVVTLLKLPGWLLFGLPGGALLWRSRGLSAVDDEEISGLTGTGGDPHALFDELAADAHREGYTETDADLISEPMHAHDITPADEEIDGNILTDAHAGPYDPAPPPPLEDDGENDNIGDGPDFPRR